MRNRLIRNLKVLSEECITYEISKKHMSSSRGRILIKMIFLSVLSVFYLNLYKSIYFFFYLKMDIEIGLFSYLGIGGVIAVLIWLMLQSYGKQNLKVKLIRGLGSSKSLTIYLNDKKKVFYPNDVELSYDYIPAMRRNQLPTPIFCLNLYSLNRLNKYRLITIDCRDMIITKSLFDQFFLECQPLIEWLNLPVHKDVNPELMKYYFRDQ